MKPKQFHWMMISVLLAFAVGVLAWPATLPASGQDPRPWRVWRKLDPCSTTRQDWVSVATQNPGSGGLGHWDFFPGSHGWATRAQALAEADDDRLSPLFSSYCCKDYSVWQNNQTGKYSVVTDKFGTAGFGWNFVKGPLCCDEAYALAGLAPSCGGGGGANATQWNVCETYAGEICGNWTFDSSGRGHGRWGGVEADLSITINGRDVTVTRRDRTSSLQATYHGTLSADGTRVSGQVTWCCDGLGNRSGTWRAQITGGRIGGAGGTGGNRGGSGGSGGGAGGSGGTSGGCSGSATWVGTWACTYPQGCSGLSIIIKPDCTAIWSDNRRLTSMSGGGAFPATWSGSVDGMTVVVAPRAGFPGREGTVTLRLQPNGHLRDQWGNEYVK